MTTPILKKIDALKAKIDGHRPLDGHMLKQVREYFRIDMTYSSNALEGNSLTETETKIVIEDGISIGGKPVRDHLDTMNKTHKGDAELFIKFIAGVCYESAKDYLRLLEG